MLDSIVRRVIVKHKVRAKMGQSKYGTNLDRDDLMDKQWLVHLQEELMDGALYIEKILQQMDWESGEKE